MLVDKEPDAGGGGVGVPLLRLIVKVGEGGMGEAAGP